MLQAKQDLLVLAAKNGNERAYVFLCKYYQKPLLRFSYRLCGDHQMAQDAVQNGWLKTTRNLRKLEDPRAFKSWLFRAVRWSTYDLLRRSKKHEESILPEELEQVVDESSQPQGDEQNIVNLLKQLPAIDGQAVYLFYLEDMSVIEISDIVGVPTGTIKSRLNRARNTLRNILMNQQAEGIKP